MIGAHGYVQSGMIIKLGFIVHTTNDALCPGYEEVLEEEREQNEVQPTPTPVSEPE